MSDSPLDYKQLTEHDAVHSFDCGSNEWDIEVSDFLKEDALSDQTRGLNTTWLFQKDGALVGYTSLVASTLKLKDFPDWVIKLGLFKTDRTDVPCVLIAQFGVCSSAQNEGNGTFILSWVRGSVLKSGFGVKLLTLHVDVRNDKGRRFWTKQKFINYPPGGGTKKQFLVFDLYA